MAGGVAVAFALIHRSPLLENDIRGTAYQTFTGVSGVLLSVSLLAVTLVFTVTGTARLHLVLKEVGTGLRHLVTSSIMGLTLTTIGTAGLYLFKGSANRLCDSMTVLLFVIMLARFGRLWWLMCRVLQALVPTPPPVPEAAWTAPVVHEADYVDPPRTVA